MSAVAEIIVTVVVIGMMLAAISPMALDAIESHHAKKARAKVGGFKRKTETTISFASERANPTLAELAKFVEEAQLAGVDLNATVVVAHVYDDTTRFEVTQQLDMLGA